MRKHPGRFVFSAALEPEAAPSKEVVMKTSSTRIGLRQGRAVRVAPRNPLVAAARFRRAGAHGASGKAQRQQAQQALRCELAVAARERHRQT
jgi:hypothetical protein